MSDFNKKGTPQKYRVIIPEADEKLRKLCIDAAEDKYGVPLPTAVHERLERELSAIKDAGHASVYLIGTFLAKKSISEGYPVTTRGAVGSSFAAYLSGITTVNPLQPHYFCPKCKHFEIHVSDYKIMGYDLSDMICPKCGNVMNSEGANIEPEVLMGLNLDYEPDIILNIAAEARPILVSFLKDTFGEDCVLRAGIKTFKNGSAKRNVHPGGVFIIPQNMDITKITEIREEIPEDDFGLPVTERDYHWIDGMLKKYDLLAIPELSLLAELELRTGVSSDEIRMNDKAILEMLTREGFSFLPGRKTKSGENFEDEVIRRLHPRCFSDYVRISAMMHGVQVWNNNAVLLLRNGHEVSDCISTRDDVYQKLLAVGVDRLRAWEIMNHVRKGLGLTKEMKKDMRLSGIPDWFIESCEKIRYLFPKSHAAEYGLLYFRLAYYKLYFPVEYEEAFAIVN